LILSIKFKKNQGLTYQYKVISLFLQMKKFSLIGAAGYIAPQHIKAIKNTGNQLVSIFDVHDKMSSVDQYFPKAACFSDPIAYHSFHTTVKNTLDFVTICTPNHLHFEQIKWAISQHANVICEKPLVLIPEQLLQLRSLEKTFQRRIFTILQLRLLDVVQQLKKDLLSTKENEKFKVDITYISARGNWYFNAWKGNEAKSGGLMTNIGIHLFDMLLWLFGPVENIALHKNSPSAAAGFLELEKATVSWFLSVDASYLTHVKGGIQMQSFRTMQINDTVVRLDEGFENLHTLSYQNIIAGNGVGIDDAAPSIELCYQLRTLALSNMGIKHPLLDKFQ
jgi:UDP-N-acetyl-2-amino-2-deoxyglucuronate dehydrogenase